MLAGRIRSHLSHYSRKALVVFSSIGIVLVCFVLLDLHSSGTSRSSSRHVFDVIDDLGFMESRRRLVANTSACDAPQVELQPCNYGACAAKSALVASACAWSGWSEWTRCDCGGVQKRQRTIATPGGLGAAPCSGPQEVIQPCTPIACDGNHNVDCKFAPWTMWSDCTKSCQGGQQYHTREVIRQQEGLGVFCSGPLHETRVCNVQICPDSTPVDCQWGDWTQWSTCPVTCGNGEKERSREVVVSPKNGGRLCTPVSTGEFARCGDPCQDSAIDCLWSVWESWSACSKTCGRGQRIRSRHISRQSKSGGVGCAGFLEDFQDCFLQQCSLGGQDCAFGRWSDWSDCSAPCNGHHSHSRRVGKINMDNGLPCQGPTTEVKPCNIAAMACNTRPMDCEYSMWEAWSTCSRTCGGGMSDRKRSISIHAEGSGVPCSGTMEAVKPCNVLQCPGKLAIDCTWTSWSKWSACTLSCGGGEKRRHRSILLESSNGGKPCDGGNSIEVGKCNAQACLSHKMVCEWASWGTWSTCERSGMSVNCGGGQRKRSRVTHLVRKVEKLGIARILQAQAVQDVFADAAKAIANTASKTHDVDTHKPRTECNEIQDMLEPCAENKCDDVPPSDCAWDIWSSWSSCPCNGVTERHRVIAQMASGGGMPCEGSEVQAKMCNPRCREKAAIDCLYSTWSGWGACTVSCGSGNSTRFRTVVQYPQAGGRHCIDGNRSQRQQRQCNNVPCPVKQDCKWGDWSVYSACSLTCGGGQMNRARQVVEIEKNGGRICDKQASSEVIACNPNPCPSNAHDCEFSNWNDWQACSQTCGVGSQYRDRVVMIDVTMDGKPCKGQLQDYRECSLAHCAAAPQFDCRWGIWSVWSACTALCNGHRERSRAIERFSKNGGATCKGTERDIKGCNVNSPVCQEEGPQDCVLGSWQMWTSCSKRCDGGQHYRTRDVSIPARNFGKPCEGSLQQTQACNEEQCPGKNHVDCVWDDWETWSACSASCSGGQKVRHRGIAVEARSGGLPCAAQASMELMPCSIQTCADAMEVCGWSQWNDWEECSQSCGGGQQQHVRLRQWLPAGTRSVRDIIVEAGPSGIRTPQRRLLQLPSLGGPDDCTGSQKAIRPCGIGSCNLGGPTPIACQWGTWSEWSACSCDGIVERGRRVSRRASNGGLVCMGPLRETKGCNPMCETQSVDCSFSIWTAWSACSATCGGGQRYHSRALQTHAEKFGSGCHGQLEELQACNSFPCEQTLDCKFGDWAVWSTCSRSCGGGQKRRSRDIMQYPKGGGRPCEDTTLMEVTGCGAQSCTPWSATDCKWTVWSSWGACSTSCGHGRHFRTRNIAIVATHHGKPCTGYYEDYKDCRLPPCGTPPADCTFSLWSQWSQCVEACFGNQERTRDLDKFASGDGGKPCQGVLRQVRACAKRGDPACEGQPVDVDCDLAGWSQWSACTRSCSGGQRFSRRHIIQQAKGSGKPCDDSLQITEACHTDPCSGSMVLDCRWADWGPYSACTVTCGGGQMHRHRSILKEAQNGGRPCAEGDTVRIYPCSTQQCNIQEACTWTPWSTWQACSASCGVGEKKRRRDLVPNTRSSYNKFNLSNLDAVYSHKVGDAFIVKHDLALLGLAFIGALLSVIISGAWISAACPLRRSRRQMQTQSAIYMPVSTEESEEDNIY